MNQQPSNTATARDRLISAPFSSVPAQPASLLEQQRWEREIFFQPSLVEAERRAQPKGRSLGLLLAMMVGLASWGSAIAQDQELAQVSEADQSSESTLSEWMWDVLTGGGSEEPSTDSLKSGEDRDPEEGDPK